MTYNKHTWVTGEKIEATKLNNIEQGIFDSLAVSSQVADLKSAISLKAPAIVEYSSGKYATFINGSEGVPVIDLNAQIDYNSSGWTSANIHRSAIYPFDKHVFSDATSGIKTILLRAKPNTTYTAKTTLPLSPGGAANVFTSNNSLSPTTSNAGLWQGNDRTFTTDADGIIKVLYRTLNLPTGVLLTDYDYLITVSGTETTYVINWASVAGTIYGGQLDVTTGILTSTLAADGSALATPITYQLAPTEVTTVLGANGIYSDTGSSEVEYIVDIKSYIDGLTASDDDMIADANIESGKYFTVNNRLYISTTAIAQGTTIVVGTNCNETNIAEALNALNA